MASTGISGNRQSLLNQIRDLWTYTSTALEGNTLTLGETKFVIEEWLTVGGKPLKDHQEVMGHVRAIDLIYGVWEEKITESCLFAPPSGCAVRIHRGVVVIFEAISSQQSAIIRY